MVVGRSGDVLSDATWAVGADVPVSVDMNEDDVFTDNGCEI